MALSSEVAPSHSCSLQRTRVSERPLVGNETLAITPFRFTREHAVYRVAKVAAEEPCFVWVTRGRDDQSVQPLVDADRVGPFSPFYVDAPSDEEGDALSDDDPDIRPTLPPSST